MDIIKDWPSGPLDSFRKNASFNWKLMKLHLFPQEVIAFMEEAYGFLENDPDFHQTHQELSLDEERYLSLTRMKKLFNSKIFNPDLVDGTQNPYKNLFGMFVINDYGRGLSTRFSTIRNFPMGALTRLGTERHSEFIKKLRNLEVASAFCMTEIGHGSNMRGMRTEAKYDPETQSFILHTPDFEAAKCWAGSLGKSATHAVVYAQLYTPDGICHGLNGFIVPIRDVNTLHAFSGVTVFDMGAKIGLNGIDNGVLIFNHYSIPRENLLNRICDVTPDGKFVSQISNPRITNAINLGNVFGGRIGLIYGGSFSIGKPLTIAIRYSHIRKQFGPLGNENPIISYPLQQWRLFPYMAAMYVLHFFGMKLWQNFQELTKLMASKSNTEKMALYLEEIHAITSTSKPIATWLIMDAIQECREACGGHGYLKASGFGLLRDDCDALITFEGDNNVLMQQTSNWLISLWQDRKNNATKYPLNTLSFLLNSDMALQLKWDDSTFGVNYTNDDVIKCCLDGYEWLVCWLCLMCSTDLKKLSSRMDRFSARNNNQLFRARSLSFAYVEYTMICWFQESILEADSTLQPPLKRLCALFALTRLLKHSNMMIEGALCEGSGKVMSNLHFHIKRLLTELLPDSLSLTEVFSPPDFILRSALGNSDGKVYEHLQHFMMTAPGALQRDKNWKDFQYGKIISNL